MQFDKDLQSEYKALFLEARDLLLSYKNISETKKTRITTYSSSKGGVCHLRTMPHGVDIGFLKGSRLKDEQGLLTGTGKAIRVLSFTRFDKEQLCYYINQAIAINTNK